MVRIQQTATSVYFEVIAQFQKQSYKERASNKRLKKKS